jgi:DNA polymerase-1
LTASGLKNDLESIRKAGRVSVLISLTDGHWSAAQVTGIALSWKQGASVVSDDKSLELVCPVLEDASIVKIMPDLKVLTGLARREKIELNGFCFDLSLASYLCDPAKPSHRLEEWISDRFSSEIRSDAPRWLAIQAEAALNFHADLEKELREKELETLFREVEIPLAGVLARIEEHGIGVDPKAFAELKTEIDGKLKKLTAEIEKLAGGPFNLNSPRQLAQILFEQLKLPVIKKTKTGISTDEEVLRKLSDQHPLPKKILEYRELAKLSSTYVEAIPALVDEKTGCVHASFNQAVTATGRLSSSSPNLQNIPIRNELGRQIRRGFVPRAQNGIFLAADYSQIELRIFAHLSGDKALTEAFRQHQDIHRVTAADIFHLKPEEVTGDQRASAKTINFGILYGMTAFGLSRELGVPVGQAQEFIDRYFERYPAVKKYLDRSLDETKKLGYCVTLFNRRRYIPELNARVITVRQFAERMAINAPVQGSSADLIKVAMVLIDREIQKQGFSARMVCQVHDELIFDLPAGEEKKVSALVKSIMESPEIDGKPFKLSVPLEVNLKSGRNWYEASHD